MSVNLLFGICSRHMHLTRLRRRRAYAPSSNSASHEKINPWDSFSFLYKYGAPLGGPLGRRSSATNLYLPLDTYLKINYRANFEGIDLLSKAAQNYSKLKAQLKSSL